MIIMLQKLLHIFFFLIQKPQTSFILSTSSEAVVQHHVFTEGWILTISYIFELKFHKATRFSDSLGRITNSQYSQILQMLADDQAADDWASK